MPDLLRPFRRRHRGDGPLTCQELVELVTDYLEGGLDPDQRARFEAHVAACEHCAAYLDQMRDTLAILGELPPEALSQDAERDLRAAFRDWRDV
jgi:anti-sigma factor RsiW